MSPGVIWECCMLESLGKCVHSLLGSDGERTCNYYEDERICRWAQVWVPEEGMIGVMNEEDITRIWLRIRKNEKFMVM